MALTLDERFARLALRPLETNRSLTFILLEGCPNLEDLSVLSGLENVEKLVLVACPKLLDLSPLANITNLKELTIVNCSGVTSLAPLAGRTSLKTLTLIQPDPKPMHIPESLLPIVNAQPRYYGLSVEDIYREYCRISYAHGPRGVNAQLWFMSSALIARQRDSYAYFQRGEIRTFGTVCRSSGRLARLSRVAQFDRHIRAQAVDRAGGGRFDDSRGKGRFRRSPVTLIRRSEGLFTEPVAAARSWQREAFTLRVPTSQPTF